MAKNKVDPEKLKEFFKEVSITEPVKKVEPEVQDLKYNCPKCHSKLANRTDKCPRCGYQGYIPMSENETKKIRWILFVIILIAAILVYLSNR
jgi:uncharacterized paraquat-inducible protein A